MHFIKKKKDLVVDHSKQCHSLVLLFVVFFSIIKAIPLSFLDQMKMLFLYFQWIHSFAHTHCAQCISKRVPVDFQHLRFTANTLTGMTCSCTTTM